jgi:hypothetical protein
MNEQWARLVPRIRGGQSGLCQKESLCESWPSRDSRKQHRSALQQLIAMDVGNHARRRALFFDGEALLSRLFDEAALGRQELTAATRRPKRDAWCNTTRG